MSKSKKPNYKEVYEKYHSSPEAKKHRAMRNKARREAEAEGKVSKGDGKEVDHIKPLGSGGGNGKANRRVVSREVNRSRPRPKKK